MNPFNYISIAQGDGFYDRTEETLRMVKTLAGGNNIVLFAPRRYGKTSLVFRVMEELEKQEISCVYFDLMPVYSLESFVSLYLNAIYKKQTVKEKFVALVAGLKSIRPKLDFDAFGRPELSLDFTEPKITPATVADVLDLPEKMSRNGRRIVVVFDEFQEIRKFEKYGLESLIRSKIQLQHNANYLFLGSKTHLMQDMFLSKNRPFYNSALTMQLSTLPEIETCIFLENRFAASGIVINRNLCMHLIHKADNVPYYIQLLAAEIWQYMVPEMSEVTEDIIDECVNRIIALKHDYYFELFDRFSPAQKRLLVAIARSGENIFSSKYIARNHLVGASSIQKSLAALVEAGVVEKTDASFVVGDPFFRQFILQETK
ncbi:MAG: hypothetical protein J6S82_03210 [Bacteroidales bacterium]|nr:hypothetical protein [Bacteroidales bacterium]MBR4339948.1 hypothetical protein [Bacteroidales bacterium]MBR4513252.1 hypothetical protein [Bacteroidales bacterium]